VSDNTNSQAATAPPASAGYRSLVLLMLFIVYAFNFLDRQIISILAIPIQEELLLTDRQLGLLGGIAFAALYSTLGIPIAWLADRKSRTLIITISLAIWSGFTAVCGLAQNFIQLFLARVGVGVGEAGGVAPSYTLIADYFPPESRARALAIYSLGIPIGSAFGVIAGAQIAGGAFGENLDWRTAFIIVGGAGILIAPIFYFTVREPKRGGLDGVASEAISVEKQASENGMLDSKPTEPRLRPTMLTSLSKALVQLLKFSGRTRRSEFWWPYFLLFVIQMALNIVSLFVSLGVPILLLIGSMPLLLAPAMLRRMHDSGRPVAWLLLPFAILGVAQFIFISSNAAVGMLLSLAGGMVLVGLLSGSSVPDNDHGPSPVANNYIEQLYAQQNPGIPDVLAVLLTKPTFWLLTFGAASSSMMGYGVFFWVPSFFRRSYFADLALGEAIVQSGWLFGIVLLVGGTLGIVLGGILSDWMGKGSKRMYAIVPAIAFLITLPFYVAGVMASTPMMAVALFIIPTGLGLAWLGPTLSAFQHMAPPNMRSQASAVFLLINNLLGIGVGVYVLGELSTVLTPSFGDDALRYSIMIGASLYAVAGILFLLASRSIERDWEK
jgi:MFS family permease